MNLIKNSEIPLFQFNNLSLYFNEINHFVSTRNIDSKKSPANSFTIGLNGKVENARVLNNRRIIAENLNFTPDSFVFASQVHGCNVYLVGNDDRGKGAFDRKSYLSDIDAMITNKPNICLISQAADCVPILFFDPVNKAIGAAHAGWKGTVLKIAAELVKSMTIEYNSNPKDLVVGIGPSIGPCCYEVGDEVVEKVNRSFKSTNSILIKNNKYSKFVFNLWEANLQTLLDSGLDKKNIELSGTCTKCNNDIFFSARAGDKGRFGAGIMIRNQV